MNTIAFFISGPEIILILLVVVMVFGTDKIPDIARGLGKGIRHIKDATNEIKKEINDSANKTNIDEQVTSNVTKELNDVKDDINDITGPIKRN